MERKDWEELMQHWQLHQTTREVQIYDTTKWWCADGDGVTLYINLNESGFELECFSGYPGSHIYLDRVDFMSVWDKACDKPIGEYSYAQQCLVLADWFCKIFCDENNIS